MKRANKYQEYLKNPNLAKNNIPRQTKFSRQKQPRLVEATCSAVSGSETNKERICENISNIELAVQDERENECEDECQDEYFSDNSVPHYVLNSEAESLSSYEELNNFEEATSNSKSLLFTNSKINQDESAVLIYSFVLRNRISKSAIDDLLHLIRLHMPDGSSLVTSKFKLMKKIDFDYSTSTTRYYCKSCNCNLDEETMKCKKCTKNYEKSALLQNGSFYISFCPTKTVSNCLKNQAVAKQLYECLLERNNVSTTDISQVYDGKCYKDLRLGYHDITCTLNSDGVPVFKSSKISLWPILYSINELGYKLGRKHTLCLGIWFGDEKPNFSCFLQTIKIDVKTLALKGVKWSFGDNVYNSKVYFPMLVADSVARPMLQGLKQFNGSYGCTWCLIKGKTLQLEQNKKSHKWIYPSQAKDEIVFRTHTNFINHLKEFQNILTVGGKATSHYGVKMAPILLTFPKFDIINGFVFDYMHTALLGVTRTLTSAWFDSKNHSKRFYIGKNIQSVNDRLLKVLVPHSFDRPVRSLGERKFWKANEWRTWTYVTGIVLIDILDHLYLKHFMKYVEALMLLCSECISLDQINQAENLLFEFVHETGILYGESFNSYNMHLLLHAAECVRNWGPLYLYSAFAFENYNGVLLNFFKGAYKVSIQISNAIQEYSQIEALGVSVIKNPSAQDLYKNLINSHHFSSTNMYIDKVIFIGAPKNYKLLGEEQEGLTKLGYSVLPSVISFNACIVNGKKFTVSSKTTTKRCNSVFIRKGKYFLIRKFVQLPQDKALAIVVQIIIEDLDNSFLYRVKKFKTKIKIIPCAEINSIQFIVIKESSMNSIEYFVKVPNSIEAE